jgi:hypothetical protein
MDRYEAEIRLNLVMLLEVKETSNARLTFRAFNFEHFFINIITGFLITPHVAASPT